MNLKGRVTRIFAAKESGFKILILDLDDIEHDPYVLISMISALHEGAWTVDEVRFTLQDLFDRQYILIEVKVVFVVIVGFLVGVEVVLKLVLQTAIVGLGPQHIRILRLVGAGGHRTHKAVAHRHHRGHTRLHQQKQEHTAQRKEQSHGMPLGKGHRLGGQLFRGDCRFFGSLGALLGGFPRPLLILPFQLVFMPHPGGGTFGGHGLFLGKLTGVVIRRGFDIPGLGAGGSLGRVFPDGLFHLAFAVVEGCLPGTLDEVTALTRRPHLL